jgi:hypothetical protein
MRSARGWHQRAQAEVKKLSTDRINDLPPVICPLSARFEFSEPSIGSRTLSMLSPSQYFFIDFEQRDIIKKLNVDFRQMSLWKRLSSAKITCQRNHKFS